MITQLRARQHELTYELEAMPAKPPSHAELTARGRRVRQALETGSDPIRKSLVHALVEEIRVTSRDAIVPVFRVPGARIPDGAGDSDFPETERFDPRTAVPSAGPVPALRRSVRLTQQVTLPTTPWRESRRRAAGAS